MTTLLSSESGATVQQEIFKTLLRTPHRSVDEVLAIHREQLQRDPYLYGRLAVYAVARGECAVRDVQNVFLATLFTSDYPELRNAAWVMLQDMPAYRIERILKYVTGYTERIKHSSDASPMPRKEYGVEYERARYSKQHTDAAKRGKLVPSQSVKLGKSARRNKWATGRTVFSVDTYRVRHNAHNRSLNRVIKSAVKNYLRYRELDENREMMEGCLIRMRQAMRTLYAKCHLLPGNDEHSWINRALFHNEPPEGSRIEAMKRLVDSSDPTEQAQIIVEAKLPFAIVYSLVKTITPSVLIALVDSMSPQELLANLGKLKREGVFNNPELRELVENKIRKVKKARRGKVDALKGDIASEAVEGLDEGMKALVTEVTDAQLKLHGKISADTALLVDKSGSMTSAIELGKKIAAAIAQAGGDKFKACYLFGSTAVPINFDSADPKMSTYSGWQQLLRMHVAGGTTNMGSCLAAMIRSNIDVEQIILITDEGDNGTPKFSVVLKQYEKKFGHMPNIVIVRCGTYASDATERRCKSVEATVDVLEVADIDKISLPNLLQLLSRKSLFDLVQDILELPLPTRDDYYGKHPQMKPVEALAV